MTPFQRLLVDAVAVYRLTRLATTDEITEPIRGSIIRIGYLIAIGAEDVEDWEADSPFETWTDRAVDDADSPWLARLVTCRWCMGIWIAIFASVARRVAPRWWSRVAEVAAVAAAAGLLSGSE